MAEQPEKWTLDGFIAHFIEINEKMKNRSFAFLLGAGASKASGIPTGAELVEAWLQELRLLFDTDPGSRPMKDWATPEALGIPKFDHQRAPAFYPQVFERRFRYDREHGYAYLEDIMEGKEPSFGYSILAQILARTRHSVVITTNFDDLVSESLLTFTGKRALVCGHESLTGFIATKMRRPVVAKIHRDLLLAPKNDPDATSALAPGWEQALRTLLKQYQLVVIGYGGNDGSLMDLLEKLEPSELLGRILWCYRESDGSPDQRVLKLLTDKHGVMIPICGFDELMLLLGIKLGYGLLADEIQNQATKRAAAYRKSFEEIERRVSKAGVGEGTDVSGAVSRLAEMEPGWWGWTLRARHESDPAKREQIYRSGLQQFPNSAELAFTFADFLTDVRKNHDEAERLYRRALKLAPDHPQIIGSFAAFLTGVRKNYDEAERLYRRALELAPDDANILGNFGAFLLVQGRISEAKDLAERAWAWHAHAGDARQGAAAGALYRGLIARIEQKDDSPALARLKTMLSRGFQRSSWSFDGVLAVAAGKLSEDENKLYAALAAAILDADRVADLEGFERWKDITPIALDVPWPKE